KERVARQDWFTLLVVMFGMILFFMEEVSGDHQLGNLIALFSGLSFAGIALGLRLQKGESTLESLFLGHLLTALVGLPFILSGPWPSPSDQMLLLLLG